MFHLDDSMADVFVYGVAIAVDVLTNRQKRSLNIFLSQVLVWH